MKYKWFYKNVLCNYVDAYLSYLLFYIVFAITFVNNFVNTRYYEFCLFISASRQIRRRVPYAGHLMTPRRLWLNKIPTLCDVVIEFPGNIKLLIHFQL